MLKEPDHTDLEIKRYVFGKGMGVISSTVKSKTLKNTKHNIATSCTLVAKIVRLLRDMQLNCWLLCHMFRCVIPANTNAQPRVSSLSQR